MKVLLLLAFVGMMSAAPFIDTKTVLSQIDKDKFGNTILSLISLNVASKNTADELSLVLEEVITQLEEDQREFDRKNATDQAFCDETIASLEEQISNGEVSVDSLTKAIADNKQILENAQSDLDLAVRDYDETSKAIEVNAAEREEQHEKWAASDADLTDTIIAVDEATKLIQHMIHGVAFAQIKGRYEKVLDKFQNTNSKHSILFKPIILSLSQLATKLNFENVQRILELLANIRSSLVDQQENDRMTEQKAQEDWETLDSELKSQVIALADKKTRLTQLITSSNSIINRLYRSLEERKVELENSGDALAETVQWCDRTSIYYDKTSDDIQRQLNILERLQDSIEEKFAAVSDFVQVRQY